MKRLLIVVDMQNDFVTGVLGTPEARAVVPAVEEKIRRAKAKGDTVAFTKDTHGEHYLDTQEGKNLPVPHCLKDTEGWALLPSLRPLAEGCPVFEKPAFGSPDLARFAAKEGFEEIELIGVCTDICVISNALLVKAAAFEVPVFVDPSCCAGVTPKSHENALKAMQACQIHLR